MPDYAPLSKNLILPSGQPLQLITQIPIRLQL